MYSTSLLGLTACSISSGLHLHVWVGWWFCCSCWLVCRLSAFSVGCRLTLVLHLGVTIGWLSITGSIISLLLLSSAVLRLFFLFLLRLGRWRGQDSLDLCLQRLDLGFHLVEGVGEVLVFWLLQGRVDGNEVLVNNLDFIDNLLLLLLSQFLRTTGLRLCELGLDLLSLDLLEQSHPLIDLAPKPPSILDGVSNSLESAVSLLVLLQNS